MYRDRGVYVFPEKDKMRIFAYDGENAVEYPPLTYAEGTAPQKRTNENETLNLRPRKRTGKNEGCDCSLLCEQNKTKLSVAY